MKVRWSTLRGAVGWIYVLATAVPLLLLSSFGIYYARGQWNEQERRVGDAAEQAAHEVDEQLSLHVAMVQTLAAQLELADRRADAGTAALLDVVRTHAPGFVSMLVADASGRIIASSPAGAAGTSVLDRSYFTGPAAGEPWHVSDVFRGRILGSEAIVGVSAPLRTADGRFAGIVQGSLRLAHLAAIEQRFTSLEDLRLVVLDGTGAVVYGGGDARFPTLSTTPVRLRADGGSRPNFAHRDPDTGDWWLVAQASPERSTWHVLVMQPVSVVVAALRTPMLVMALAAAWSLLVISMGLRRIVRHVVNPVEGLAVAMREFNVTTPHRPLELPAGTAAEIVELARTFDAMAERTTHIITGLVPICAACKRIRDEDDHWLPVETFVHQRSEAEFTHGLCPQCAVGLGFPPLIDAPVPAGSSAAAAAPNPDD